MNIKKHITVLLVIFLSFAGYAQKGAIRKATKDYDKFEYVKTSQILLDVAQNGYKSVDLFQKLGNSFYFNNKMEDASKWYAELVALNEPLEAEYYYRYAQSLKATEQYEESDKWMKKFTELKSDDLRGKAFKSTVNYLLKIDAASRDFEVYNLDLNSPVSDFGSTQYKNELIFSSSRDDNEKIYKWNDQPYLQLYKATKDSAGSYSGAKKFNDKINTKYHESSVSFTPDDKILFFTRNNFFKNKLKRDAEGINRLQIYRSLLNDEGTWDKEESIHFNSRKHSTAHPSVNVHGKKLYFASDMDGTLGQSDIYVVDILENGKLGTPINLGKAINTEGQETFPFINEEGDLYFSSNGFTGLGGLDVYVVKDFENKYAKRQPIIVENVGRPINSPKDDFAYNENLGTREGFFSSNRDGGKGDDDIYSFRLPCTQLVEGVVVNKKTQELIPNSTVTLFDESGEKIEEVVVGNDAAFTFTIACNTEYLVRGEKETYTADEKRFTTPEVNQELELELQLDPNEQEIKVGDDLAEILNIPIIYFDFDRDFIRIDAAIELQKVIAVMKRYPNLEIDVRSHTDSRASFTYNADLSTRRNKSTIKYIIEVGQIEASRLTGRGYGESNLTNRCSDGVECTEEEHDLNRRSEFIVVKI